MKLQRKIQTILVTFGVLATGSLAQGIVTMNWVIVGDAGNAADSSRAVGNGAVGYNYKISKYEVTIGQYAEFLNATAATDTNALYDTSMGTDANISGISRSGASGSYSYATIGSVNRPITYVSWNDAARFANWMSNGQGTGDTENGVYDMSLGINAMASSTSSYRLPTEDEWHKAAYYDPSKGEAIDSDNYWQSTTQSDTLVDNSTSANYKDPTYVGSGSSSFPSGNALTDVGSYTGQDSYYGTFDQGGNVFEVTDGVSFSGSFRALRGGSWRNSEVAVRSTAARLLNPPSIGYSYSGFRLASVPEPSSITLLGLGSLSLILRRRRG